MNEPSYRGGGEEIRFRQSNNGRAFLWVLGAGLLVGLLFGICLGRGQMQEEQMRALQKQVHGDTTLTPTTDVAIVLDTFDRAYGEENRDRKYGGYPGFIVYYLHGKQISGSPGPRPGFSIFFTYDQQDHRPGGPWVESICLGARVDDSYGDDPKLDSGVPGFFEPADLAYFKDIISHLPGKYSNAPRPRHENPSDYLDFGNGFRMARKSFGKYSYAADEVVSDHGRVLQTTFHLVSLP